MIFKKYLEKEKEGKQQCQNCLEFGHWTYECTRPQAYLYRPSRTKLFKQNKFDIFKIKEDKKEENSEKDKKNDSKSNSRSNSRSHSSSSSRKSYSSGSSPNHRSSRSYSSSSSSSSFSRSGHSENSIDKRRKEMIQNKKRQKLNDMLDNIQKYDNSKKRRSRSKSRSRSYGRRGRNRRSRSRSRSRSRDKRKRREEKEKTINKEKNDGYNNFFSNDLRKLGKNERWKKNEEIEMENAKRSPSYGRKAAFRRRPYD